MSTPIFYRLAAEKAHSDDFRALIAALGRRAEEFRKLELEFPDVIKRNKAKRTGKPVVLTKSQESFLKKAEAEAIKAEAHLKEIFRNLNSEREILQVAQQNEKMDLDYYLSMKSSFHPEDQAIVQSLLELKQANLADISRFMRNPPGG
jgi:excinuclease UvrABC nuclease subunit